MSLFVNIRSVVFPMYKLNPASEGCPRNMQVKGVPATCKWRVSLKHSIEYMVNLTLKTTGSPETNITGRS